MADHWSTQDQVIMVAARSHGSWQKTSKTTAMAQHDARIIVVAGATGLQGGAVSRRLLRAHWRVRALTRNPDGKKVHALAQLGAEVRHRC